MQERTLAPDFWDDAKAAEAFLKETAGVRFWVEGFAKVQSATDDLDTLMDFGEDASDDTEGYGDHVDTIVDAEVSGTEQIPGILQEKIEELLEQRCGCS